jgi:hypothetical protein
MASPMSRPKTRRGHYLGTEIGERWWRRYTGDGLLARGAGEYWIDRSAFFFHRFLTCVPIVIALRDVERVRLGRWHAGRWAAGRPVLKVVWRRAGTLLSSGFVVSSDDAETTGLAQRIQSAGGEGVGTRNDPLESLVRAEQSADPTAAG